MTLASFLSTPLTIVRRSSDATVDEVGDPVRTETEVETVGDLQQSSSEEAAAAGEAAGTVFDLYLPAGTELDTTDRVRIDGEVYEVVGHPEVWRGFAGAEVDHVAAKLRRTGV